jgi:hypothetical protein
LKLPTGAAMEQMIARVMMKKREIVFKSHTNIKE